MDLLGTRLADRYDVRRELGRGGMGSVYLAHDLLLERDVAIKILASLLTSSDAEQRFKREALAVARMDHPSIVGIHDLGTHDARTFLVMPFVDGEDLRSLIGRHVLTLGEVIEIGIQVAQALDYSHDRGVVHRDIKPENVIVTRREGEGLRVRITDFGIALVTSGDRLTKTGSLIGTAAYLSPEQAMGTRVDGRADIYALATVLYECVTGEPPFTGSVQSVLYRIIHEQPQPPRVRGVEISEAFDALLVRCLDKNPDQRPQRPSEVVDELLAVRAAMAEAERERRLAPPSEPATPRGRVTSSVFVGRQAELHDLQRRLALAIAGECQLVLIGGHAGVGKSRLIEELEKLARVRDLQVLHGRFVDRAGALPYQGFGEMIQEAIRQQARRRSVDPDLPRLDLADLGSDLLALFPVLAELDELRLDSTRELAVAGSGAMKIPDPKILFELIARTLARLGGGRPLVLVMQDLHAADVSIEALAYVARRLRGTPTLLIGSYLDTEIERSHPLARLIEAFEGDARLLHLALGPLPPNEHRQLLEQITGGALDERLAAQLFEATEGNPFFARELVRTLLDGGSLLRNDATGSLDLAARVDLGSGAYALPQSIHQAVERRVDRLSPELRRVLAAAAVLGRSFEYRDLEALVGDIVDLDGAVDGLLRRAFLEEKREAGRERLRFASGVVRDVIYGATPRRQRRSLHLACAENLERRWAGRLERVYPLLVEHSIRAEAAEKVILHGLELVRSRLAAAAYAEARRAAGTVLEFLEDSGEAATSPIAAEARLLLAEAARRTGEFDLASTQLERAAATFERCGERARWSETAALLAETAWRGRRVDAARRWIDLGLPVARTLPGEPGLRTFLQVGATLANLRGDYELGRRLLDEAARLDTPSRAVGSRDDELPRGGRLSVGLSAAVLARHPGQAQLVEEDEVFANVFETLVSTDPQGVLVPHLASAWRMLDGGRVCELELRPGVRLHDGRELAAVDVKASFEVAMRLAGGNLPIPFAGIVGASELLEGRATEASGITVVDERRLRIALTAPLPIYPALLTDAWTAIACATGGPVGRPVPPPPPDAAGSEPAPAAVDLPSTLVGTGPFRLAALEGDRVLLERNPDYWRGQPARVEQIEFRTWLSAAEMAAQLRSGRIDLARDLLPEDLETLLRDRHLRAGLVEAAKTNSYFVLFNSTSSLGRLVALRMALCGVVRTHDLVRSSLGRFAEPAEGLIPPGILGHDPGRRRRPIGLEDARELLRATDLTLPLELVAAVHPVFQDRYAGLVQALFAVWRDLGIGVTVATPNLASYMERTRQGGTGIDLLIGRWVADYDDPDNFTFGLFHSRRGRFRHFFAAPQVDQLCERARASEVSSSRVALYRKIEDQLLDDCHLLPLFHEVDYRVAGPKVRGLTLGSNPPYVNYHQLAKVEGENDRAQLERRGGVIQVPLALRMETLDPLVFLASHWQVIPTVFETLTRPSAEARITPWLAADFQAEDGGRRWRFQLRPEVRFHDGRRLHARDVRYSFERLLTRPLTGGRFMLSPIRGAQALLSGELDELTGFQIVSASEFVVELEQPVSFFPALLTAVPIVPAGLAEYTNSWSDGCVGTGPFRIRRFEVGRMLDLEASPYYWRAGYPRAEGLNFHFGVTSDDSLSGLESGLYSLAWDLAPAKVAALRQRGEMLYREVPSLSTYFLAFDTKGGPLADVALRRELVRAVDVDGLVARHLAQQAIPARTLIPPGLLGHDPGRIRTQPSAALPTTAVRTPLSAMTLSVFSRRLADFTADLLAQLAAANLPLELVGAHHDEVLSLAVYPVDVVATRWLADYPDADSFLFGVLHSAEGDVGRLCGSPEIDELIERGRLEHDPAVRDSIYREIEDLLARQALLLPLFHEQAGRFARPEVRGFEVSLADPVISYEKLWIARD
jgi:ABC-type transport system substrate-binding protein